MRDGIRRMYSEGEECFYYLTVYNENYVQAAKPTQSGVPGVGVDEAIAAGLYRLTPADADHPVQVRLLASGPAVLAAQEAATLLGDRYGVAAEVWSTTSWKQLRDDALEVERWNRRQAAGPRRTSYLRRALGEAGIPVIAVTDYVTALPDQLARFVGAPFTALGTDGYGFSDTRADLRAHFGTDAASIAVAAVTLLADSGRMDSPVVANAADDDHREGTLAVAVPSPGAPHPDTLVA